MYTISTQLKFKKFFSNYPQRRYSKGQILIHAEDQPYNIFLLDKGRIKQYRISDQGNEIIVNVYREQSIFPITNLSKQNHNRYFYDATDEISVRVAPREAVQKFLDKNPDVVSDLFSVAQETIELSMDRMAHLMASSAYYRLLYELVHECQLLKSSNQSKSYKIPLREYELANQAGLSRETANRELKKLKNKGFVSINRQFILVKNLLSLKKELGDHI